MLTMNNQVTITLDETLVKALQSALMGAVAAQPLKKVSIEKPKEEYDTAQECIDSWKKHIDSLPAKISETIVLNIDDKTIINGTGTIRNYYTQEDGKLSRKKPKING